MRLIFVRSWTLAVISTSLFGLTAFAPATPAAPAAPAARAGRTSAPAPAPRRRVASAAQPRLARLAPVAPASRGPLDIDVPGLRRHVQAIAKLLGHPARELAAKLGTAAMIEDGSIEWNLADLGVDAASAYGYASVVDGRVTGLVIRGRASLDKLLALHLHRPLQLTQAGGERPAYSITAGE